MRLYYYAYRDLPPGQTKDPKMPNVPLALRISNVLRNGLVLSMDLWPFVFHSKRSKCGFVIHMFRSPDPMHCGYCDTNGLFTLPWFSAEDKARCGAYWQACRKAIAASPYKDFYKQKWTKQLDRLREVVQESSHHATEHIRVAFEVADDDPNVVLSSRWRSSVIGDPWAGIDVPRPRYLEASYHGDIPGSAIVEATDMATGKNLPIKRKRVA